MKKVIEVGNLKVKIFESRDEMGIDAAVDIVEAITKVTEAKGECNMIFAAAPSQSDMLACLSSCKQVDWSKVNAFHMDEYIGLQEEDPQGFGNFLRSALFDKIPFKTVNYINGNSSDFDAECERYSALLKEFPVDIVCMGIGENGHIAFNNPHVANFNDSSAVKVVDLDEACRIQQVNDGCFKSLEQVPKYALTLTIPPLMAGEHLFCVVPTSKKAKAVQQTILGEINEKCPASILRRHSKAVLYLDIDSAILL